LWSEVNLPWLWAIIRPIWAIGNHDKINKAIPSLSRNILFIVGTIIIVRL
jgi:hypothetical protein